MGVRWMQLAAQCFHEDPDRVANVRNRGVYEAKHEGYIITVTPLERVPGQRQLDLAPLVMCRALTPSIVGESSLKSKEPVVGRSAAW